MRKVETMSCVFVGMNAEPVPGVAYQSVLRWLLSGLPWLGYHEFRVACKESLNNARQRLGALPMQKLHEEMDLPMAEKPLLGSCFKDLLLVAFDGSTLAFLKKNDERAVRQ